MAPPGQARLHLDCQASPSEVLDPEQDLPDGDGGLPVLVLVQDAEAHRPRGIDVGVEQGLAADLHEFALWRLTWIILGKFHGKSVSRTLPRPLLPAGDAAVPLVHVLALAILVRCVLRIEAEGVVLLEAGTLLRKALRGEACHRQHLQTAGYCD